MSELEFPDSPFPASSPASSESVKDARLAAVRIRAARLTAAGVADALHVDLLRPGTAKLALALGSLTDPEPVDVAPPAKARAEAKAEARIVPHPKAPGSADVVVPIARAAPGTARSQ